MITIKISATSSARQVRQMHTIISHWKNHKLVDIDLSALPLKDQAKFIIELDARWQADGTRRT